jgi:uncharacterized membrane protein
MSMQTIETPMSDLFADVAAAFSNVYSGWIAWNLFLAFIPLVLSFWLFRRKPGARSLFWWLGFVVFIAFLPNAPYLLTDIIHLIRGTRITTTWIIALVFIPLHCLAILMGFEAYVISLLNQEYYLKRLGLKHLVPWANLMMHGLCAIGVYLGRFRRYNSWDLVVDPQDIITTINDLTHKLPFLVVVITFLILVIFSWLLKQLTLGMILRIRYARSGKDVLLE